MLTVAQIRALKPRAAPYKVVDVDGLFQLVQPSGGLFWRSRFRAHGIEKNVPLAASPRPRSRKRASCETKRARNSSTGSTPSGRSGNAKSPQRLPRATFRLVADEYIQKIEREGKARATIKKSRWFLDLLDKDIGKRPVSEVTPHELLAALKQVERRGHHETVELSPFAGALWQGIADDTNIVRGKRRHGVDRTGQRNCGKSSQQSDLHARPVDATAKSHSRSMTSYGIETSASFIVMDASSRSSSSQDAAPIRTCPTSGSATAQPESRQSLFHPAQRFQHPRAPILIEGEAAGRLSGCAKKRRNGVKWVVNRR